MNGRIYLIKNYELIKPLNGRQSKRFFNLLSKKRMANLWVLVRTGMSHLKNTANEASLEDE